MGWLKCNSISNTKYELIFWTYLEIIKFFFNLFYLKVAKITFDIFIEFINFYYFYSNLSKDFKTLLYVLILFNYCFLDKSISILSLRFFITFSFFLLGQRLERVYGFAQRITDFCFRVAKICFVKERNEMHCFVSRWMVPVSFNVSFCYFLFHFSFISWLFSDKRTYL